MPNQVRGMTPEAIRALFKRRFDEQSDDLKLKLSNYNDEVSAMKSAMEASLEALNNDVGSSIEKATSEAKRANDAIVALDAFDKAVANQIAGVLDQSQAAIAEANALLAQMPEFEKKAQDAIDKVENISTSLTTYKESQQKLLDELSKKADNIQGGLEAQDAKMTQALADWSKDFEALKSSVNQSVDGITKDLSDAVEEQLKISPILTDLSNKLDTTNDNMSRLNKDYSGMNQKLSDITGLVEPLSQQAQQAASDAQKAIDALRNPSYIGSSVLTVDQITGDPHWTKDVKVSDQKTPDGDKVWAAIANQGNISIQSPQVLVDSRIPYKISFWAKADGDGSLLSMQFLEQNGGAAIGSVKGNIPQGSKYFPFRLKLTKTWTKYESVVRFKSWAEKVKLEQVLWNDTNVNNTQQYIGGFKFFPLIPDQATIDTLQNNAILKNTKIGESNTNAIDAINEGLKAQATLNQKQQEWNAVQQIVNDNQQAWNKTQETVNANQSKWNQAVDDYKKLNDRLWGTQGEINKLNQAIDANQTELLAVNTRAIREIVNGHNLIPYYKPSNEEVANGWSEWTRPAWAALDLKRNIDKSVYKGFAYYTFDSTKPPAQKTWFDVDPSLEYDYEVWLRGTEGGVVFIECRDEHYRHAVRSGAIVGDNPPDFVSSDNTYLITKKITHPKWTKYKTRIRFNEDVRRVWIASIYANHGSGVQPATVDIGEDMRLYPHIPSQEDVNKALQDADKALQDQIKANTEIDAAQTRADEGFYKAIKALSMPEEANSLLAYIEPTDAEIKAAYEAGKPESIVYDQPEWTLFGHEAPSRESPDHYNKDIAGEWAVEGGYTEKTKYYPRGKASLMPVMKGIPYKLSFYAFSSTEATTLFLQFYNQKGEAPFANSVGYIDGKKEPGLEQNRTWAVVSNYITLKQGTHKYEFRLNFTPDTTAVRFDAIGWHFTDVSGKQRIFGMRFVPDIPSQAEIDKAQNNAIINNSNAIAINNWSDKIQTIINQNQQKQINYLKKFQDVAVKSQKMTMPRFLRVNYKEGWSKESPDFDQFFDLTKDSDFWNGKIINFRMKGRHNGFLMVYSQYLQKSLIDKVFTQMDSYAIVDGKQEYRADGTYKYYNNVYFNMPIGLDMQAIVAVYYPHQLPDGSVPSFPSPPSLNTKFPPKPYMQPLE
nr:MAG TPA: hypothetical protein [Caudoviricetes sp.]